jgi:hypothetical protein
MRKTGESLSNSTTTNGEKTLGKYVTTFLEFVFEKEKDRECASAILKSLPLPRSTGDQKKLIADLTPKYPPHYWHAMKKLRTMGVIKLDKERIKGTSGKTRYVKAFVYNPDFVQVLDKMATGFNNLRIGKKPEEE